MDVCFPARGRRCSGFGMRVVTFFFGHPSALSMPAMWQPRISGTYTVNPNNVIRFSYGRYTEAPDTAEVQYNTRQQDLADYLGQEFYQYGRNTPGYPIAPPASLNYDVSPNDHGRTNPKSRPDEASSLTRGLSVET